MAIYSANKRNKKPFHRCSFFTSHTTAIFMILLHEPCKDFLLFCYYFEAFQPFTFFLPSQTHPHNPSSCYFWLSFFPLILFCSRCAAFSSPIVNTSTAIGSYVLRAFLFVLALRVALFPFYLIRNELKASGRSRFSILLQESSGRRLNFNDFPLYYPGLQLIVA